MSSFCFLCWKMSQIICQSLRFGGPPSTRCLSVLARKAAAERKCGDSLCGYTVKEVAEVPELEASVIQLTHDDTGAHHLHIAREDTNNTFSVGFPTIPMDSTGVSHILEHTALCGSEKFPVRDPFFRMLTRSLSNFMNAFTANDWTMYLFSTQNSTDYQNLLSVYLDCVFYPQLRSWDFRQEGWRLEHTDIEDKLSPIIFKGVVFNEMKGYFANSENVYSQALQNFLFPSHTYSVVSGGKPLDIVDLTLNDLKRFQDSHYHPSNSFFFTYGDIPLETHLQSINDLVLKRFKKSSLWGEVPLEKEWLKPREEQVTCPPDPGHDLSKQTTFSISFKLPPITDSYESFILKILSLLLVDGPASNFHKTLLGANLGSNFSPSTGYNDDTYEAYFSIGLQGLEKQNVKEVERLIFSTFEDVIQNGFSKDRLESVLHKVEISIKDQKSNFGLILSTSLLSHWMHGGNPVDNLKIDHHLERFKMDLQKDEKFLQSKVQKYFLDNQHQLSLTMTPSATYEEALKREEAEKLFRRLSDMSKSEIDQVFEDGMGLRNEQNSKLEHNPLPTIHLSDVEKAVKIVNLEDVNSVCPLQFCVQPTNGLTYLNMAVNFSHLPEELKMYVPLFCYIATRVGAGDLDHVRFAEKCDLFSNGLSIASCVTPQHDSLDGLYQELLCTSYCLDRNLDNMLSLWTDVLTRLSIEDTDHLWNLLKRLTNNLTMGISHSGHRYAASLSSSSLTPSCYYREKLSGITQIKFLRDILENKSPSEVKDVLMSLADQVFDQKQTRLLVHTGANFIDPAKQSVGSFVEGLPTSRGVSSTASEVSPFHFECGTRCQVKLPFPVNFVGQSLKTVPSAHDDSPRLAVLGRLLGSKYLHKQIREIGGAYGSGASHRNGVFSFFSYRDPNSLSTVKVFNESRDWIAKGEFDHLDVEESKISVFSEIDSPLTPSEQGMRLFLHRLSHESQQKYRDLLFEVDKDDLMQVSQKYLSANPPNTCIIGQQDISDSEQWENFSI